MDCSLTETFTGGLEHEWELTNPEAVRVEADILRLQFWGAPDRDEHAVLSACTYGDLFLQVDLRDLNGSRGKVIEFGRHGHFAGYGINFRSAPYNDMVLAYGETYETTSILAIVPYAHATGQWLHVEIWVQESMITVKVDGNLLLQQSVAGLLPVEGWISLGGNAGGDGYADMEFDNFSVSSTDAVGTPASSWGMLKAEFGAAD